MFEMGKIDIRQEGETVIGIVVIAKGGCWLKSSYDP